MDLSIVSNYPLLIIYVYARAYGGLLILQLKYKMVQKVHQSLQRQPRLCGGIPARRSAPAPA